MQKTRRIERLGRVFQRSLSAPQEELAKMLTAPRVNDPTSDRVMKVYWKEYERIRQDPEFVPFPKYASNLLYYTDKHGNPDMNRLRPTPVRQLLVNEVGMYRDKFVVLRDADPETSRGEGKTHQVPASYSVSEPQIKVGEIGGTRND